MVVSLHATKPVESVFKQILISFSQSFFLYSLLRFISCSFTTRCLTVIGMVGECSRLIQPSYIHQWLPNREWPYCTRWVWARDRWLWMEKLWEKKGFKTNVENVMKNVNNRSRVRVWWWRRAGWWWCIRLIRNMKSRRKLVPQVRCIMPKSAVWISLTFV